MSKLLASLSLDLDNKWSYLRTHGSSRWQEYPSYFEVAVPLILDFLERYRQKITFFVVGRDAAIADHAACLSEIASSGHEIANHSFNHEPWIHLFSREKLESEILTTREVIARVTGRDTIGFRGPGYSISKTHLEVLADNEFAYDASAFPNVLNPIARAYFFAKSDLDEAEKTKRKALFGSVSDALRPIDPFLWDLSPTRLIEIPVTTMPLLRLPFHFSYVLYLSVFSTWFASYYFRFALWLCKKTGTSPSIILHPLDFLGNEDESDLEFFPGMNLCRTHKLAVLDRCLRQLQLSFRVTSIADQVQAIRHGSGKMKWFSPDFSR